MKRRIISLITSLTLLLSLCPAWALAADLETDAGLCAHHQAHTDECGYAEDGAECAFVCRVCGVEELLAALPENVTPENSDLVEELLIGISELYAELDEDEQEQLDLSRAIELQNQLCEDSTPELLGDGYIFEYGVELTEPTTKDSTDVFNYEYLYDVKEYTLTVKPDENSNETMPAFRVADGGKVYLRGSGGQVVSTTGAGIVVESGGYLNVTDTEVTVQGETYGLEIKSGATVELSCGTYIGGIAAISFEDGDFSSLLKTGYAWYDEKGNELSVSQLANAKTLGIDLGTPVIAWTDVTRSVNYDRSAVESGDLPAITFNGGAMDASTRAELDFFYRETGETEFTPGLPTNAGTYEIKASLPEKDGAYKATETESLLTLTIKRIDAGITVPAAAVPTYNREAQNLVTGGSAGAAADEDGVILFKLGENGSYSENIPTGVNAGDYRVWYKMEATENYNGVVETEITGVKILPKAFTPTVDVKDPSYVYDGSAKNPVIVLRDGQDTIEGDQYTVTWKNSKNETVTELRAADTYTAEIKSTGKNYTFNTTATVEITSAEQSALSIENKPDRVQYGDVIRTLSTSGGIGNGSVKWSVTSGNDIAEIDAASGVLTVKGVGAVTVKAVRSVDNYKPVEAEWSFTALPKEVTAVVTVANKTYDGTNTATVSEVKIDPKDLVNSGDVVTISGLTGTFGDAGVGANKTVTLVSGSASVGGKDADKYNVSYPATALADITAKTLTPTVTLSGGNLQGTAGSYYYVFDGTDKEPNVTVMDGGTLIAATEYIVSYSGNHDVGTATVTVSDAEGGNYAINTVTVNFKIEQAKAALTTTPSAKALTYTGQAQELVDVGAAQGGTVVYLAQDGEYKEAVPEGTDAGTYAVWYKVKGDGNHIDTDAQVVRVTIAPKQVVSPVITLGQSSYTYDGNAKEPEVISVEDQGTVIPASEYIVSYSDNINAGKATAVVSDKNGGNYIVNGTASFTIEKADIGADKLTKPTGKENLHYTGSEQELISRGGSSCGTMVYSTDNIYFSGDVPTGKAVQAYNVYYKVLGDGNHNDSAVYTVTDGVSIAKNTVKKPAITLSKDTFQYTGSSQVPAVTVYDDNGLLIDPGQYTVNCSGEAVDVGEYTVEITTAESSNYIISTNNTRTFKIVEADQETISITGTRDQVYYGDVIQLSTTGGTGNGTVTWSVEGGANTTIDQSGGQLKVLDVGGPIVVTATRKASDNYNDISTTWEFSAQKKAVTAIVTAEDKEYDSKVDAKIHVSWEYGALVDGDSIDVIGLKGEFENAAAGVNKKVNITGSLTSEKYVVTVPPYTTASITPKAASVTGVNGKTGLKYTGGAQELVSGGTADGGTIEYSLDGVNYNLVIPTGTNAGTYTVWYKVRGDGNHSDSATFSVDVTIAPKTVSSPTIELSGEGLKKDGNTCFYIFDNSEKKPAVTVRDGGVLIPEGEYSVGYSDNVAVGNSAKVTITNISGGNYTVSGSMTFEIRNAQASLTGAPGAKELTYDGSRQALVTAGSAANGTVVYSETQNGTYSAAVPTQKDAGTYTVWYKVEGNASYDGTAAQSLAVTIRPKEITPLVTAADKKYDGEKTAAVSVSWPGGAVVGGDTLTVDADKVKGEFSTADAGSGKQVNITVETGAVTGKTGNYSIKWPATVTASITRADTALKTRPGAKTLVFDGSEQELVTAGATKDDIGAVEYCLEQNGVYSTDIPKAANAGSYKVWYRVPESVNYMGIAAAYVDVTIAPKALSPTIELSGGPFVYDGGVKTPTVTVKDGETLIPAGEYSAAIPTATNAGTYTVTVTDRDGGNYVVNGTQDFEIKKAAQAELTITGVPDGVTYGDSFTLGTSGGSGSGAVRWSVDGSATISDAGVVTVTGMDGFTVKAQKDADNNYNQSGEASAVFTVGKKSVRADVTANDKVYDGLTDAELNVSWPDGALVDGDTIDTTRLTGEFEDKNAGENKTVSISCEIIDDRYIVTCNTETTASISKAELVNVLTANDLTSNGTDQELVSVSDTFTAEDTGEITYSLEEEGTYSTEIPKGNAAGLYKVWYKVGGSDNCNGIELASIEVRIKAPVSESSGGGSGGGEAAGGESLPVAEKAGVLSAPVRSSVSNGAATSVMSAASGRNLVSAAVANKSTNVVVKPEISGDVSKTEVSMPAPALSQLGSQTGADLTVATPVASVTLPNASLESLSSDKGTVSVATEQVENSYTLTVSADGERVDSVPGGVTLTVPVAEPAPGTVAVLVNEDGTRETIRKAVPADGELSIPLDGSATVEIVDNSKSFDDVAETDWEADAVAFASAHELFNGTSESTFSPDAPMSRAMLTMVLYNLEGRPDRGEAGEFDDVSTGSWYADSVAWATEKGITNGSGDGQFAPDESVTREQFAVMLWRYAGSPAADGELGFTDADEASGYALEALRWAAEKGIMNGYGDGRLNPGGLATRAEAAQMLKNFMQKAM